MIECDADFVILGSGFAGSLCGLILAKSGRSVVVVDRAAHPRFAIGESSTPIANFVLRDLCLKYGLHDVLPLTKYGTWQQTYPQIGCGLKRGFSYFPHQPGDAFAPRTDHANELLVTASSSDTLGDTHWLRADVDGFLANQLRCAGVPLYERTQVTEIAREPRGNGTMWNLTGLCENEPLRIRARFLIDGSGEAGALAKTIGNRVSADRLQTRSRAVFSHFRNLGSWDKWLGSHEAITSDHPFCCDDAAQHHLFDGGWMWVLRFNNNITSAGFAIDAELHPRDMNVAPDDEWKLWLDRYPSVRDLFEPATIVDPPGKIISTGVLPRRAERAVGAGWALLPNTAGFIDPLHSSGIAHSLCGIERLTRCLLNFDDEGEREKQLLEYERAVFGELKLIDLLVHGCYRTFVSFPAFVSYSMLYFAAATWYERQRCAAGSACDRWFLGADDLAFVGVIEDLHRRAVSLCQPCRPAAKDVQQFERDLAKALRPYNLVGLCDPSVNNMYRHTAPREK